MCRGLDVLRDVQGVGCTEGCTAGGLDVLTPEGCAGELDVLGMCKGVGHLADSEEGEVEEGSTILWMAGDLHLVSSSCGRPRRFHEDVQSAWMKICVCRDEVCA